MTHPLYMIIRTCCYLGIKYIFEPESHYTVQYIKMKLGNA